MTDTLLEIITHKKFNIIFKTQTITLTLILQSFQATSILRTLETLYSEEGFQQKIKLFN